VRTPTKDFMVSVKRLFYLASLTLLMPGLQATAHAAAPSCREIFSISHSDIERTIADLARLRFQLDTQKVEGRKSLVWERLSADYTKKENDLARELDNSGVMSADQLKANIKRHIKALQLASKHEKETVAENQGSQKKDIRLTNPPQFVESLPEHLSMTNMVGVFEHLEKTNQVLFQSSAELKLFNLDSKSEEVLYDRTLLSGLMPGREQLLFISTDFKLRIYDLASRKISHEVALINPDLVDGERVSDGKRRHLSISPDGTKLVMGTSGGQIAVLDIQSGQVLAKTDKTMNPDPGLLIKPRFLNNDEIIFNAHDRIAKFSIPAHKIDFSRPFKEKSLILDLEISADRKHIIFGTKEDLVTMSTADFKLESRLNQDYDRFNFAPVPSMPASFFAATVSATEKAYGIYSAWNLAKVFDFENRYSQQVHILAVTEPLLLGAAFSVDGKTAIVRTLTGQGRFLDRWVTP
jgi:hypothetical protein